MGPELSEKALTDKAYSTLDQTCKYLASSTTAPGAPTEKKEAFLLILKLSLRVAMIALVIIAICTGSVIPLAFTYLGYESTRVVLNVQEHLNVSIRQLFNQQILFKDTLVLGAMGRGVHYLLGD